MLRHVVLALCVLPLSGCGEDTVVDDTQPNIAQAEVEQDFTLAPGEYRTVGDLDLIVIFHGVLQDSRCPPTVTCVWAGDAEVNVGIAPVMGGDERLAVLHTNGSQGSDATELGAAHRLRLVGLEPASAPEQQAQYRATFRVEKL